MKKLLIAGILSTMTLSSCLLLGGGDTSCEYVFTKKSNPNTKYYGCIDAPADEACPDVAASNQVKSDYEVSAGIMQQKLCDTDIEFPAQCNVSLPETIFMAEAGNCLTVF